MKTVTDMIEDLRERGPIDEAECLRREGIRRAWFRRPRWRGAS